MSSHSRVFLFATSLLTLACAAIGCHYGGEGDRCNPARSSNSSDECGSGLSCTQPPRCPENYCCPKDGNSKDPNCQPGCNGGDFAICTAQHNCDGGAD